jgi:hypothetical protein
MDKPLCKLCGHRHSGTNHIWKAGSRVGKTEKDKSNFKSNPVNLTKEETIDLILELCEQLTLEHRKLSLEGGEKFNRTKYQREYMRKWRKQAKPR